MLQPRYHRFASDDRGVLVRRLVIALAIAAVAATSAAAASAAAPQKTLTPVQVIRASFDALNRGDAAASAAFFAPNGQLITAVGGCKPCTGRAAIQEHLSAAVANGTKVKIVGRAQIKGATVVLRGEGRSSGFPAGIERAIGTFRSTTHKGLIVRQENDYDRSDPQTAALLAAIERATGPPTT